MNYSEFLESKKQKSVNSGFEKPKNKMNSNLFEWQKDIVYWALKKGKAALFEDCGLGKTIQQLEWAQSVCEHENAPVLILAPLAVAEQTRREGSKFGYDVNVVREQSQVVNGINITNYEILNHFDTNVFCGIVLDESSILKSFTSKTRTEIIEKFRDTKYKLSCTATPAPNDYMELGNQAEFCNVMSRTEMLATYFVHDGGDTSKWRLKGHAEKKFWEWLSLWAVVLTNPADLGYDGTGYDLPEMETYEYISKSTMNIIDDDYSLFPQIAQTLNERRNARKNSIINRSQLALDIINKDPNTQWLIWCDLNAESEYLKKIIPDAVEIRGSDIPEIKAQRLCMFTSGEIKRLITKPSITGWGLNWQHCHNMIFVGLSDSYEMMYQAIRRCWRYGQTNKVNVYIVISESEGAVMDNINRKEKQSENMMKQMVEFTKDILQKEIKGTTKITIEYNPTIRMKIPEWLVGVKQNECIKSM